MTEVEEFYPHLDEKNLRILKQIGENADDSALYSNTLSESTSKTLDDSSDDSLIPKNADLPNIEDELDDVDELENVTRQQPHFSRNPNEILTQGLEYKAKHFDENSSESEDSSITSGLDFSNVPHTEVDSYQPSSHFMSQSTPSPFQATVARNIIDSLMKSASGSLTASTGPSHQKHSSQKASNKKASSKYVSTSSDEDSDFEILDKDDL